MEYKSLFLGILFSISIFSIKAGIGLEYRLSREIRPPAILKISLGFALVYAILFTVEYMVFGYLDMNPNLWILGKIVESGMTLHFIIALLLLAWGVTLIKSDRRMEKLSFGWLALILPCPLCILVISISSAYLISMFPEKSAGVLTLFYSFFTGLAYLTATVLRRVSQKSSRSPEFFLGYAMCLIAAYFILSTLIMPHFTGIGEIYGIASHASGSGEESGIGELIITSIFSISLFSAGFLKMRRIIDRNRD